MNPRESIRSLTVLPVTAADWEATYQSTVRRFIIARQHRRPVRFYCCAANRHDGHLLVVGKKAEPLYVAVVALGPLTGDSLATFFVARANDFVEINCWGNRQTDLPWSAAGTLESAQKLPRRERRMMILLIGSVIQELTEQFAKCRQQN